jgi:hypothetical protein
MTIVASGICTNAPLIRSRAIKPGDRLFVAGLTITANAEEALARFEMTMAGGEKILVDHPAAGMQELLSELGSNSFLLYTEVKSGSSVDARAIIVATAQIGLIRPLDELSTQSTTFRPKR